MLQEPANDPTESRADLATTSDPSGLLAAVEASPRAVKAHDKRAWVDLFTTDAIVQDPVGSAAHTGHPAIGRFYDTFIGPNTIEFQVERDVVAPETVVRDLTLRTTMSTGAVIMVPMHLRYTLREHEGQWKIAHLAAHWELPSMILQLLRTGLPGVMASLRLGPQLIGNLGVGGLLGMMRALRGVGRKGKRRTAALLQAATEGDTARVREFLVAHPIIESPYGTKISIEELLEQCAHLRWSKLIAAGHTVSASIRSETGTGIAMIEFTPPTSRSNRAMRIGAIRLFVNC